MIEKKFATNKEPITSTKSFEYTLDLLQRYSDGEIYLNEKILECFNHNLIYWAKLLEANNFYEDFLIYSVCRFLDKDNKPVGTVESKLSIYKMIIKEQEVSIYDDLVLLFLEFLHKRTIFERGEYKSERNLYFHIAMEMKYAIFIHIRKIVSLYFRESSYHLDSLETNPINSYEENFELKIFLDKINEFSNYEKYLFMLIADGYTAEDRCKLLYLTRRQLANEENIIWQYLRQRQSDSLKDLEQT